MTFPAPYTVSHYAYTGAGTDELGNQVDSWSAAPVKRAAQGFSAIDTEKLGPNAQGEIAEVTLELPPDWLPGIHDRIALPDGVVYEVVGFDLQGNGFHQWKPGNIVLLKKAMGMI